MAQQFFMKVTGAEQGDFPGDETKERHADKMSCIGWEHMIESPRDPRTGQASGSRNHFPVTITKEWDAASPLLFNALVKNEVLSVEFVFERTEGSEPTTYYTVKLIDALVCQIKSSTGGEESSSSTHTQAAFDTMELEKVSFTYKRIEVEATLAGKMGIDDWSIA